MRHRVQGITTVDSHVKHTRHVANVERKYMVLTAKEALLETWESKVDDPEYDYEYVLKLRARVRSLRTQFSAMRPGAEYDL